jgi:hypothetical protein
MRPRKHTDPPAHIRVVAVPPGEAPQHVREAWVGLTLPLARGCRQPHTARTVGVVTGPTTWWGKCMALLVGRTNKAYAYVVPSAEAIRILSEQAPDAADWWKKNAPHYVSDTALFAFRAEACEPVRPPNPP